MQLRVAPCVLFFGLQPCFFHRLCLCPEPPTQSTRGPRRTEQEMTTSARGSSVSLIFAA